MTLDLRPEIAAGLQTLAAAQGLSVEDYLQRLIARELPANTTESQSTQESGMVLENGLLVYRTDRPVLEHVVDEAIRRSREERMRHILGEPGEHS